MNVRATRFPLFDSLRAIAAVSVLCTHAAFFAGLYFGDSALRPYAARLDVGVHIFFLISGFLLYRPFVRARMQEAVRVPAAAAYAWRRFLRIVPAYWLALTVTTIWIGHHGVFTGDGVPTYYGFGQVYRPETALGGITQAWSLCVEVVFYAFLPLYALAMRRLPARDPRGVLRSELAGLALLYLVAVGFKLLLLALDTPTDASKAPLQLTFPTFLDQFALGMLLAVLSVRFESRDELPRGLRPLDRLPGIAWLAAALAFWIVSTGIGLDGRYGEPVSDAQFMARHALYGVVALGLLLPAVFGDQTRGLVRQVLANRVLLYLGLVSYGIYLWHFAVLEQLARWDFASLADDLHPYVWAPAALIGAAAIASASYYALERPALRLKRLVGPREELAPGEAIAEPAPASPPATASPAG